MTDTVLFADTTAVVISVLVAALAPPVVGLVPNPRPPSFVRVERVGGTRANIVADNATMVIESSAPSEPEAHDLGQLARRALHTAAWTVVDGHTIYRVRELSGLGRLPDPFSDQPRYTQTFSLMVRGQAA